MRSQDIWRPQDQFQLASSQADASAPAITPACGTRPFGLRYLVDPRPGSASGVDLAAVRFDGGSQIAVMSDEADGMPAFKHTSGKTTTTTNVDDRQASDDDTDYEQD